MECKRLKTLIREWYQQVREYTLSPLKMMELVMRHIKNCEVCQKDKDLPFELDQLREIIRVPYNKEFNKNLNEIKEMSSSEEDSVFGFEKKGSFIFKEKEEF